jgi:lipopolysaccharide/colanic/teichoic acid biosynthesis glycosyltransferase
MAGNISGSWVTAFSTSRLAEMDGVALDSGWPVPFVRGSATGSSRAFQSASASASARSIRVLADDIDDAPHPLLASPGTPKHCAGVLTEELFRSALIRERKRADRFEEVFALVTIEARERENRDALELLEPIANAIGGATRETDLLGWVEEGAIIGLMLPEIAAPAQNVASDIEARIVRKLTVKFGAAAVAKVNVRLHVHAGLGVGGARELLPNDPLVAEIDSARKRATTRESLKRVLDIVLSLTLLILLSPVFLVLAAIIKLTSTGPVFFKQDRIGQMAKTFKMFKFRSMCAEAAPTLHQQFVTDFIKSGGQAKGAGDGFFKIKKDPRITRIGHILRKTSLDELPQLWNVLRGEMSLVGPRPPLQYELEQYRSWHWRRVLEAKPGMTGLWQVEGRSRTTFDEMVRLDLRYVRTRSLWTDIRILLATPRAVVTGKGAC